MPENTQCFSTAYMKNSLVRSLNTVGGVRLGYSTLVYACACA